MTSVARRLQYTIRIPDMTDFLDMIPKLLDLTCWRLTMTNTCNPVRKFYCIIKLIKQKAKDKGIHKDEDETHTLEGDCWHQPHNVWLCVVTDHLN